MLHRHCLTMTLVAAFSCSAQAVIIHVDAANCPGPGDGSMLDPYCSIQTAIDNTVNADEIVVAPGTYFETINFLGKAITLRSTDGPDVTIIDAQQMGSVVTCDSSEGPNTVLEGFALTDGTGTLVEVFPTFFFLVGGGMYNLGSSPTVTNCTFTGNSAILGWGGGMFNTSSSSPTVTNCTFTDNTAAEGGGMHNRDDSSPTVTICTFSGNTVMPTTGLGFGGGMYNQSNSNATVTNCTFDGNTASTSGGGMSNSFDISPTVTNCTFTGNTALVFGGGMYNQSNSSPKVTNCTFSGNSAQRGGGMRNTFDCSPSVTDCTFSGNTAINMGGGGMENSFNSNSKVTNCTFSGNSAQTGHGGGMQNVSSSPTVTNCTFTGNTAGRGAGMVNSGGSPVVTDCTFTSNTALSGGGGMWTSGSSSTVTNCILWGDSPNEIFGPTTVVAYSDVQGGFPGTGNIDADPLFVDPLNGDYRLMPGSPCIDAGNNWGVPPDTADLDEDGDTLELTPWDLDGNPRFVHAAVGTHPGCGIPAVVDMGAYEFQDGKAVDIKLDDIDGDGTVNIIDLLILLASWGPCEPGCCLADLDIDGDVGITDFLLLLASWGR